MKSKIECPYCDGTAVLNDESREITFKEMSFSVKAHFYKCELCGEEFTATETDTQTIQQVLNV